MPVNKARLDDAFWSDEIGFVCDPNYTDAELPDSSRDVEMRFAETLQGSGRLPDLNGAPMASWLLARLAALSSHRFPYHHGQVLGSDGANFWLRFIAFTSNFQPIGTLTLMADENGAQLWVQVSQSFEVQRVLAAFTESILTKPMDLKRTQLTVAYTDFTDSDQWKRLPFVFGWDGKRFLNHRAPEHAASAEDIE